MNERIGELWADCVMKHTKTPMNWQNVADEFAALVRTEALEEAARVADGYGTWHIARMIAEAIRKLK